MEGGQSVERRVSCIVGVVEGVADEDGVVERPRGSL
jgi:hypothetical protein